MVSIKRFASPPGGPTPRWSYLTLYEIETEDIERVLADMYGTRNHRSGDAVDFEGAFATVFEAM